MTCMSKGCMELGVEGRFRMPKIQNRVNAIEVKKINEESTFAYRIKKI